MKLLVAAPIGEGRSLDLWAAATSGYDRVAAIDQPIGAQLETYGIPYIEFSYDGEIPDWSRHPICSEKFNVAWEAILDYAEAGGYTHVLSFESDIVADTDIVALMVENFHEDDEIVRHAYPRGPEYNRPDSKASEMGCTMGTVAGFRKALKEARSRDNRLYGAVMWGKTIKTRVIDVAELQHL